MHRGALISLSKYSRGRKIEYMVRDLLSQAGWCVWRLAASKPFDLIAIRDGRILIIECKRQSVLTKLERKKLLKIAKKGDATAILAKYENNAIHFYKIKSEDKMEKVEISYFKD